MGFLPIKQSEKKEETLGLKLALFRISSKSWQLIEEENWAMLDAKVLV